MNPAQLLNPKAFAKEKAKQRAPNHGPKQSRKLQPSTQNRQFDHHSTGYVYPPRNHATVHGSNPSGSMACDGQPAYINGEADMTNGGDSQVGMGDFMGRLHNTTERDTTNYRKHRLPDSTNDEDDENKKAKTVFAGGGTNGGIISEHMKEERKKIAAEAAGPESKAARIDLTLDNDDDDVVFMGQKIDNMKREAEREVCIGVLRCQGNCSRVPHQGKTLGGDWYPPMRARIHRVPGNGNIIDFYDKKDKHFARLDFQSAQGIALLMDGASQSRLRIKAYLDRRARGEYEAPGAPTSVRMNFILQLYCPKGKAEIIGKFLSQRQLFLDTPLSSVDGGTEIYNPHIPPHLRYLGAPARPAGITGTNYTTRTVEETRRDVTTMFDGLPKNEDLPEMEANDQIIATPLMPHQKKALHFLVDHETYDETVEGSDSDSKSKFSLWKEKLRGNGSKLWHNVITGHETLKKPAPVYGGILADMMGLGKTLSILSLVAATVDEAASFKIKRPSADLLDEGIVERNAKATLIVCPKSVLSNWSEQITSHIHFGKLSVYVYHGTNRIQDLNELSKYDIILTSYGTVANEVSDGLKRKRALISMQWFRIVLDEAHMIRNAATRACKGACALAAQRRWAVTGTPVQNSLNDLGALIRFLRVKPFDEQGNWAQYIIAPFKAGDVEILPQLKLLVAGITLRREKDNIGLKGRKEENRYLDFTFEERKLYSRFAGQSHLQLKSMTRESNTLRGKSYAHVLKSLLRLRMLCDHGREMLNEDDLKDIEGMDESNAIELGDEPGLELEPKFISEKAAYELLHIQNQNDMDVCSRCSKHVLGKKDPVNDVDDSDDSSSEEGDVQDALGAISPCYHVFCHSCRNLLLNDQAATLGPDGYHDCPICSAYVRFEFFDLTRTGYQHYLDEYTNQGKKIKRATWTADSYSGPHTKVRALLEELDLSAVETAMLPDGEPPIRSVVFSEWTSYLDLIEFALDSKGVGYVRLDGKMNVKQRSQAILRFRSDPSITVMIVSIRAGGQGLNFTAANKVYMMEPQFNPGVEQQAIDRVHRLGQLRDVEIVHFIMNDSVEQALLKLQDKKVKLANLSMEKKMTRSEETKARMDELKELFK